ncbi:MAG: hypothetical protein J7M18_02815 [Candidatus Eremiobacteraeota bacterium]|nr:hypothetical protein [Candidatus Eremiobacteraeota bacterium]
MADLRQKIKSQENILEKLARFIPGFSGYKERELRRSADKMQRDFMAGRLAEARRLLLDVSARILGGGGIHYMEEFDRLQKRLDKVRDRIRLGEYGYSGFFDAAKIGKKELDKLYEYDLKLVQKVTRFCEEMGKLTEQDNNLKKKLINLESMLDELDNQVSRRHEIMREVK